MMHPPSKNLGQSIKKRYQNRFTLKMLHKTLHQTYEVLLKIGVCVQFSVSASKTLITNQK